MARHPLWVSVTRRLDPPQLALLDDVMRSALEDARASIGEQMSGEEAVAAVGHCDDILDLWEALTGPNA